MTEKTQLLGFVFMFPQVLVVVVVVVVLFNLVVVTPNSTIEQDNSAET